MNALVCEKKSSHIIFFAVFSFIHTYTQSLCVHAHGYGEFNFCRENSSISFIVTLIPMLLYI